MMNYFIKAIPILLNHPFLSQSPISLDLYLVYGYLRNCQISLPGLLFGIFLYPIRKALHLVVYYISVLNSLHLYLLLKGAFLFLFFILIYKKKIKCTSFS